MIPFARIMTYGNIAPVKPRLLKVQSDNSSVFILFDDGNLYNRGKYSNGNLGNSTTNIVGDWKLTNTGVHDMWYSGGSCLVLKTDGSWFNTGNRQYLTGTSAQTSVWYNCSSLMTEITNSGSSIKKISFSSENFYCLLQDGRIISSGINEYGSHGTGNTSKITSPKLNIAFNNLGSWDDISLSGNNTFYALRSDGTLYGAGQGSNGQLLGTNDSLIPKLLNTAVIDMVAATFAVVISKSDGIYVLGSQFAGQLGDGVSSGSRTSWFKIINPVGLNAVYLSFGSYMSVLKTSDGRYMCTGWTNKGSVGSLNPSSVFTESRNVPAHNSEFVIGSETSYIIGLDGNLYGTGVYTDLYDLLPGYTSNQLTFVKINLNGVQ